MAVSFNPNTTADLYLGRAVAPTPGDPPDFADIPCQQYPPFTCLNLDQVQFASGPYVSFLLLRGLILLNLRLRRATATQADWLIIDPSGAALVVRLLEATPRVQPPAEWITYWIGRDTLSY